MAKAKIPCVVRSSLEGNVVFSVDYFIEEAVRGVFCLKRTTKLIEKCIKYTTRSSKCLTKKAFRKSEFWLKGIMD